MLLDLESIKKNGPEYIQVRSTDVYLGGGWIPGNGDGVVRGLGLEAGRRLRHHGLVQVGGEGRSGQPARVGSRAVHGQSGHLHLVLTTLP